MKTGINFLRVDLVIQRILGVIYFFSAFLGIISGGFFLITMITQFVIGIWQVLSALIFIIFDKSKSRLPYFFGVTTFFAGLILTFVLISQNIIPDGNEASFVIGLVVLPVALGIWYYIITLKEYKTRSKISSREVDFPEEMNNILDSEELLR